MVDDLQFSSFRGDFAQLAAVMQRSWAENKQQPLFYTEPFLRSAFEYPGSRFDLASSLYSNGELLAFAAGFPRRIHYDGKEINLLMVSFVTASSSAKGHGYGRGAWGELFRRARSSGFDGTIHYCVEGDAMNEMMPGFARRLQLNTQRIYSVEFLTRFLRPAKTGPAPDRGAALETFLELAATIPDSVPLVRLWTRNEAIWNCQLRSGVVSVQATHGPRRGLIAGYLMDISAAPPAKAVMIDDLFWGTLEPSEQAELLREFLLVASARGAQTASCPVLHYASLEPLLAQGFQKSKRVLHAYLSLWNGQQPRPVSAMYIDVL